MPCCHSPRGPSKPFNRSLEPSTPNLTYPVVRPNTNGDTAEHQYKLWFDHTKLSEQVDSASLDLVSRGRTIRETRHNIQVRTGAEPWDHPGSCQRTARTYERPPGLVLFASWRFSH